jgi:hypothetical protein
MKITDIPTGRVHEVDLESCMYCGADTQLQEDDIEACGPPLYVILPWSMYRAGDFLGIRTTGRVFREALWSVCPDLKPPPDKPTRRKQLRRELQKHHPDKGGCPEQFMRVMKEYEQLTKRQ